MVFWVSLLSPYIRRSFKSRILWGDFSKRRGLGQCNVFSTVQQKKKWPSLGNWRTAQAESGTCLVRHGRGKHNWFSKFCISGERRERANRRGAGVVWCIRQAGLEVKQTWVALRAVELCVAACWGTASRYTGELTLHYAGCCALRRRTVCTDRSLCESFPWFLLYWSLVKLVALSYRLKYFQSEGEKMKSSVKLSMGKIGYCTLAFYFQALLI